MQWDHLSTFEAVARLGSMTAAARSLRISQSTVSRHVAALERIADSPLLVRDTPLGLTDRGAALLEAVLPMIDAALAARSALEHSPELVGEVTITTVGEVLRWALAQRLGSFYRSFPRLRLRILADNMLNSLAAGEADIALRFARPEGGDLVGTALQRESYGFYAADSLELHDQTPWLGLAGSLARIPEQRFAELAFADRAPRLVVEDVESLGMAVRSGLGVAILPRSFARRLDGVVEVQPGQVGAGELGPIPSRTLYMVAHRSRQNVPKVRAVMDWLRESGPSEGGEGEESPE